MPESESDPKRRWLGLEAFAEEDAELFFGRAKDIDELTRRVARKPLTVLFGQSGLGKTSLLRAGIFPRLREKRFTPVYVRVDYSGLAPPVLDQVAGRLIEELNLSGKTADELREAGLTAWSRDREAGLLSPQLRGIVPVLVFDQFEELFTLGRKDQEQCRQSAGVLVELGNLIEARPGAILNQRIEDGEVDGERYDFELDPVHVVLSIREDYLSLLDRQRLEIPSLMENRVPLDRFSGAKAFEAVLGPGKDLVSREVAERIVCFVAGHAAGTELAAIEVEPSLLSLVCSQLDRLRGEGPITNDLLSGKRDEILVGYYEDCFKGIPGEVRSYIEDHMVTEGGYRETVAAETVIGKIGETEFDHLVDRRLLHAEVHHGLRRVELTHDVLTGLVVQSRTRRWEQERQESRQREAADASRLKKRRVALGVMIVVFSAIAVMAGVASYQWHRAEEAMWDSREAQKRAEKAGAEARAKAKETAAALETTRAAESLAKTAMNEEKRLRADAEKAREELDEAHAKLGEAHAELEKNARDLSGAAISLTDQLLAEADSPGGSESGLPAPVVAGIIPPLNQLRLLAIRSLPPAESGRDDAIDPATMSFQLLYRMAEVVGKTGDEVLTESFLDQAKQELKGLPPLERELRDVELLILEAQIHIGKLFYFKKLDPQFVEKIASRLEEAKKRSARSGTGDQWPVRKMINWLRANNLHARLLFKNDRPAESTALYEESLRAARERGSAAELFDREIRGLEAEALNGIGNTLLAGIWLEEAPEDDHPERIRQAIETFNESLRIRRELAGMDLAGFQAKLDLCFSLSNLAQAEFLEAYSFEIPKSPAAAKRRETKRRIEEMVGAERLHQERLRISRDLYRSDPTNFRIKISHGYALTNLVAVEMYLVEERQQRPDQVQLTGWSRDTLEARSLGPNELAFVKIRMHLLRHFRAELKDAGLYQEGELAELGTLWSKLNSVDDQSKGKAPE